MKRIIAFCLTLALCIALPACATGKEEGEQPAAQALTEVRTTAETVQTEMTEMTEATEATEVPVEVDLTTMSSTMVYSEVSNMITDPDSYRGKTVCMNGTFSIYDSGEKVYFACLIAEATACFSNGIEFLREG